ncbi:MAG TPA: acylphosphatase [Gemmatimonadota bacterium]|nr:acylphosphatase [Gemmatimonadota bacterium]
METRRIIVHGRVQGVGFRWFVLRNASDLGVNGTIRNREDGAVEAVFQSDRAGALEELIGRVRAGPRGARVRQVEVHPLPETRERYQGMQVVG